MTGVMMRGERVAGKTYSLPTSMIDAFEKIAEKRGVTASSVVREAFDEYLDKSATRPARVEEKIDRIEAALAAVLESVITTERNIYNGEDA